MIRFSGYDDCIIGYSDSWTGNNRTERLIYDADLIIARLLADGMSVEEAWDYFHINIAGAYLGEETPIVLHAVTREEIQDLMCLEEDRNDKEPG